MPGIALAVYTYAPTRSGETPKKVLGNSTDRLVVDQHTGYNTVTKPGGRLRVGRMAHARRRIFEQREHPEAKEALGLIAELYRVERDAKEAGVVGTDDHLALRRARSRPLFARLLCLGRRHRSSFEPRSGMGKAIGYLLRHFRALGCFLRHATIPPNNNVAEASLRRGRQAWLFMGSDDHAQAAANIFSLVASCRLHDIDVESYLADIIRVMPY